MPGKLETYHAKRNFGVTPEPRGRVIAPQEELRFVIQKHHARKLHYDFRLEFDGTLKSWAVPRGPSLDPKDKRLAVHVEDHPLDYIDFEGTIPEAQYGAGHVEVWDTGTWEPDGDPSEAYRQGKIKFRLHGKKLQGGWTLVRTRLQASSDKEQWLLIKERDDEARAASDFNVTEALPDSVLQDRDVNEGAYRSRSAPAKPQARKATIKAGQAERKSRARKAPMPDMASPQLATLDQPLREIRREEAASMAVTNGPEKSKSSSARPQEAKGRKGATGPAKKDGAGNDDIAGVRITHPDRIIDPSSGLSKRAMAQYYADIAPWLLPWMKDRPAYLLRCPEGIQGQQFFQKHSGRMEIPGIRLLDPALDLDHPPLMTVGTVQALVGAAQMGTIELHIPGATVDRFDRPDYMVFDLDPDPDLPWKRIVEAAQLTHVMLEELGLRCFLKTSGGRGLHIVVPLARRHAWADVTAFSEAVARHLAETVPKVFSATMGAQNRQKKVFIDYLRNQPKASTVAPYAARARPNLPVSMPIDWNELPQLRSAADWTVENAVQRLNSLKQDPWADFASTRQTLTAAMKRKLGLG
jgi:bifunctional non-homologous end joining protein LigD